MLDEFLGKQVKNKRIRAKQQQQVKPANTGTDLFSSPKATIKKNINWGIVTILGVSPIIISVISAVHIYEFFKIGNSEILSIALAGSFEFLAMASLVAIWELKSLNKSTIAALWAMILLLVLLMISGNVYSTWLNLNDVGVNEVSKLLGMEMGDTVKRAVAFVQGALLPIMSLSFIKILANYIIVRKQ